MSGSLRACADPTHRPSWRVTAREVNRGARGHGRAQRSPYSQIRCPACNLTWRSKAAYVATLPDWHQAVPFDPGTGPMAGYVAGLCGHRVAESEWRAGYRTCEQCGRGLTSSPATSSPPRGGEPIGTG